MHLIKYPSMIKVVNLFLLVVLIASCKNNSADTTVSVNERKILVNKRPYLIKGICYHPVPIGSDKRDFSSLTEDLALMKEAGINTIRVYEPIDNEVVLDEINKAGFMVVIGFGYDQGGVYDILSGTYIDYVEKYKNHNAILMWELGNEYNYHPEWFENDIKNWYKKMDKAALTIHEIDKNHLVTTAHGELPDSMALSNSPNIDVWGMNVYRWDNPEEIFEQWKTISNKPMYLSEAGYDKGVNEKAQADANVAILEGVCNNQEICSGVALFSFTDGWIDWNMVLDKQGGPNWFENWCMAPVIVDPENDEVYFTPIYYTMAHFSRYLRPGAVRIGLINSDKDVLVTAVQNPKDSIAVVILNEEEQVKEIKLSLAESNVTIQINGKTIQAIIIPNSI